MSLPRKAFTDLGFAPEAFEKLTRYEALIRQWQKAINLVSPSTLPQLWERHLLDSAQLWPIIKTLNPNPSIIDLGSGGGLPGIVLAIAGAPITMIESDSRKCIFLRETARELGLDNVTVITQRIEKASAITAPIITARALASMKQLVEWASPLVAKDGAMVFLKGQDAAKEIAELPVEIHERIELFDSITDKNAKIVVLKA